MQDQNAINYIISQLQSGLSAEDITNQLRNAGWGEDAIQSTFAQARGQLQPAPTTPATPTGATAVTRQTLPEPIKRGRMKTGWLLFKQSLNIIRNNSGLTRYVIMSAVWAVIPVVLFVIIIFIDQNGSQILSAPTIDENGEHSLTFTPLGYLIALILGYFLHVITYYYGVALSSHALGIFRGKAETYGYHIGVARRKLPAIFLFAFISLVVGYLIQLTERIKVVGWIVSRILGATWALATVFVLPVIADTDDNGGKAVKESMLLFKKTWGETITGHVSVGGLVMLLYIVIGIPVTIILAFVLGGMFGVPGLVTTFALYILGLVVLSIFISLATSILNTSLYYYAQYGTIPPSFSPELLASVMTSKQSKVAK